MMSKPQHPESHKEHLSKDKKLAKLISTVEPYRLEKKENVCLRLCASIMSQQLSTHVAEVIYARFLKLYGNTEPTPQQILETEFEILRAIGLSNAKVNYIQNVARYFIEHKLIDETFHHLTDDQIVELLLPIKGVGKWTIEMLLMFTLGREDVFSVDDLGIMQTMVNLYKLENLDKKLLREKMQKIAVKWSPYRTYACFYLWRFKDGQKKKEAKAKD